MHKFFCCLGEVVSYCFSRSSIRFQGHIWCFRTVTPVWIRQLLQALNQYCQSIYMSLTGLNWELLTHRSAVTRDRPLPPDYLLEVLDLFHTSPMTIHWDTCLERMACKALAAFWSNATLGIIHNLQVLYLVTEWLANSSLVKGIAKNFDGCEALFIMLYRGPQRCHVFTIFKTTSWSAWPCLLEGGSPLICMSSFRLRKDL